MMTPKEYFIETFGEEPPKKFEESEAKDIFDFCKSYAEYCHQQKINNLSLGNVRQSFTRLKNENELRKHFFQTIQTTAKNHYLPFKPRWLNKLYADISGLFWLKCHKCGNEFGGHEWYGSCGHRGICPTCVLEYYNETGKLDEDLLVAPNNRINIP